MESGLIRQPIATSAIQTQIAVDLYEMTLDGCAVLWRDGEYELCDVWYTLPPRGVPSASDLAPCNGSGVPWPFKDLGLEFPAQG